MTKRYFTAIPILFISFINTLYGQTFDGVRISLKGGILNSTIKGLETTVLSEPFFLNYTLSNKKVTGFTGGFGINYEIKNSIASINLDVLYAQQGTELLFNNTEKNFNYRMQFNYSYINFPILLKLYPFEKSQDGLHGINVGVGPQIGINLSPENIVYTSGGPGKLPAFGTDLQQQQQIRNVLKGKNNFGINFHLGYDFRGRGFNVDLQYHYGLTDVVRTEANAYNFIENKNTNQVIRLCLSWELFSSYPKKSVLIIRNPRS